MVRTQGRAYVYLIYRVNISIPLRCTDLVGKVGKGTGDRKDAYRTPYGSKDLNTDVWDCHTESEALELEGIILAVLEMRGWLRFHTSGKRSEVISFIFKGSTQKMMLSEYTTNMRWIQSLINYYHQMIMHRNVSSDWDTYSSVIKSLRGKVVDLSLRVSDMHLFSNIDMNILFQQRVSLKYKDDRVIICIKEGSRSTCQIQ